MNEISMGKNLEFLKNIYKYNVLSYEDNKELKKNIDNIERYIREDELKVAMIGEFSSGKSTLLNAILNNNYLSVSDEPTTAINTYIRYGDSPKATVFLNDGTRKKANINELDIYLKENCKKDNIKYVNIECPVDVLKEKLTLIDTPGANVDIDRHNIVRSEAINEANATVVVISAQSSASKTFIKFLKENKKNLYKFIFVINKCDTLDNDIDDVIDDGINEVEKVSTYVKSVIEEYGGIRCENIHCISAKAYLEKYECDVIDVKLSFEELIKDIKKMASIEKNNLINVKLIQMMNDIHIKLKLLLDDREVQAKQMIDLYLESRNLIINKDNEILDIVKSTTREEISNMKSGFENITCEVRNNIINEVQNYIISIDDIKELKNQAARNITQHVRSSIEDVSSQCNDILSNIYDSKVKYVKDYYSEFYRALELEYSELNIERRLKIKRGFTAISLASVASFISYGVLSKKVDYSAYLSIGVFIIVIILMYSIYSKKAKSEFKLDVNYVYKNSNDGIVNMNSDIVNNAIGKQENAEEVGAVGLAFIGGFIAGPIGAGLGAALGSILGGLFGPSLEKVKEEYIIQQTNEIDNFLDKFHDNMISHIEYKSNEIMDTCSKLSSSLNTNYDYTLKKVLEYNKKMTNDLKQYHRDVSNINTEVVKRLECIENNQKLIRESLNV